MGAALAAHSERPNLQWTFRILDDASVNAMALPGGHVYVTRGLLTYLNSEAELAAVIGHEIGHVTARHTVNQLSKQQVANLGVVLGMILRPELRNYGSLANVGLGLLFLKYSRDDENEADTLGLRYVTRAGYDPRPMADVFTTLERVSATESQGRVPGWLSTHPSPGDRRTRIAQQIRQLPRPAASWTARSTSGGSTVWCSARTRARASSNRTSSTIPSCASGSSFPAAGRPATRSRRSAP